MVVYIFISVFDGEQYRKQCVNEHLNQSDKPINYEFISPRVSDIRIGRLTSS